MEAGGSDARMKRGGRMRERLGLGDDVPYHLCIIYVCIHHVTVVVTQRRENLTLSNTFTIGFNGKLNYVLFL